MRRRIGETRDRVEMHADETRDRAESRGVDETRDRAEMHSLCRHNMIALPTAASFLT